MNKLFLFIAYVSEAISITFVTKKRFGLPVGEKPKYSKAPLFLLLCFMFLVIILMLPYLIIKAITKNITKKDADESIEDLSKRFLIVKEGLSFFEWRDAEQVFAELDKKGKVPENLIQESKEKQISTILLSLLLDSKIGFCEARIETREEFIEHLLQKFCLINIPKSIKDAMEEENLPEELQRELKETQEHLERLRARLGEKFDEITKFNRLEQTELGIRFLFKAKNIGTKKEPPKWLSRLVSVTN